MKSLPTLPLIVKSTLEQPRFSLLDSVQNRIMLIAFCSIFCFLFMYIFLPFNINMWYEGQQLALVQLFGIFTGCGMVALTISQFALARWKWRQRLTNATYLLWFFGEIVLVTAIVTAVDVLLIDTFFLTWSEFINTLRYTALIMPLPYFIALLWFYTREKLRQLHTLEQEQLQPVISVPVPAPKLVTDTCLQIRDENDKPVLSLHPGKLLLLKAEDNYVHVFYLSGTTIAKELVRTSLKKLEAQLSSAGLTRAHRSYLVNLSKVVLFKKNTKGHYLQLEGLEDMMVPVSNTWLPGFQQHFK
ncbi:LytTR family DNA-binding domain-containing protein [Chitinophaga solisilvae]|uniref:LytTR family DNA-binding domain-containing protein n=1 Tax=Chitinophaga solisilvae TaxID=1233460 RepID=UPI00136D4F96|nr:LytTR family DNA-binding domain-containing protein [Chitinophaga solisilvae]